MIAACIVGLVFAYVAWDLGHAYLRSAEWKATAERCEEAVLEAQSAAKSAESRAAEAAGIADRVEALEERITLADISGWRR